MFFNIYTKPATEVAGVHALRTAWVSQAEVHPGLREVPVGRLVNQNRVHCSCQIVHEDVERVAALQSVFDDVHWPGLAAIYESEDDGHSDFGHPPAAVEAGDEAEEQSGDHFVDIHDVVVPHYFFFAFVASHRTPT